MGLPLLAHTGGEFCVRSIRNDLKSPACLRLPLECGVTVIAAHCGTRALPWDGDHFRTFLEMRSRYPNLYGDLSPLSHITHLASLERLREDPTRLLHGTDYPVFSAVFPSFLKGWISREELRRLNAIGNPLEKKIQLTRAQGLGERVLISRVGADCRTSRARKFLSAKEPINTKMSSRLVDTKTTIARPIKARNESIYSGICRRMVASKIRGHQMPRYLVCYTEC